MKGDDSRALTAASLDRADFPWTLKGTLEALLPQKSRKPCQVDGRRLDDEDTTENSAARLSEWDRASVGDKTGTF